MSDFFIKRPIFAWVLAVAASVAGLIAIYYMSVEQYPDIVPPSVTISATYTGASAKTLESSVTQVLEQSMTGLDHLLYISSGSSSSGTAQVTLTFAPGTDPDIAEVQVQNKVQEAAPRLPDEVKTNGISVSKSTGGLFMVVAFTSEDGSMDGADIADYMASTLQNSVSRIDGVGSVQVMGAQHAMRIWLDPDKLRSYSLMPSDIISAIQHQNIDVSAGSIGSLPSTGKQEFTAPITTHNRLTTPQQFKKIVLKSDQAGANVYLSDVARVELGQEDYTFVSSFNGKPAAGLAVGLASGANALKVADAVDDKLKQLSPLFPKGLKYQIAYSTTPFVKLSIREVVETLLEAIVLIVGIMYLFLQDWRVTLIPTLAVPAVILGTFGVLAVLGFSINTLTLFAIVLAIGLLVDDAIVVVENVERLMRDEGLTPVAATSVSMKQITGALVGVALVLTSIFVPMALFAGSTGVIYRQFSVTICTAMLLSVLAALTVTPALCAALLRNSAQVERERRGILGRVFSWVNRAMGAGTNRYANALKKFTHRGALGGVGYVAIVALMVLGFMLLPSSFLPEEDQGILLALVNLPPGSTQYQTIKILDQVGAYVRKQPEVASVLTVAGYSTSGTSQGSGLAFIRLKDWSDRKAAATAIAMRITVAMMTKFSDAQVFALAPSGIPGLGQSGGFTLELQDLTGAGHDALVAARRKLIALSAADPKLQLVRYNGLEDTSSFHLDIDDAKAGALGLSQNDINSTLSTAVGGYYVNDFINRGRIKRVYVQGEAAARMLPQDIGRWFVRNDNGEMVQFSSFTTAHWGYTPASISRFNGAPSMEISGQGNAGISSGTAMAEIANLVSKLPAGFSYSWTGQSFQEVQSSGQAPALYALSLLFVFLCLAALYESWSIPLTVMLTVPVGVAGALLLTWSRGLSEDVYLQVGLLATVGLSAKNAILIVEFARTLEQGGLSATQAVIQAATQRLRPILMTSLTFILGVLPLALSTGAGSGARRSLGTGVLGGTLLSTALGIFFVPLSYVLLRRLLPSKQHAVTPDRPIQEGGAPL